MNCLYCQEVCIDDDPEQSVLPKTHVCMSCKAYFTFVENELAQITLFVDHDKKRYMLETSFIKNYTEFLSCPTSEKGHITLWKINRVLKLTPTELSEKLLTYLTFS